MNKAFLFVFFTFVFLIFSHNPVLAHPGKTASDGCHYCRTNCEKWGVPYDERHCHGTEVAPALVVTQEQKIVNPQNTPVPTLKPVFSPKVAPQFSPKPTKEPIPKKIIECSATSDSQCPSKCTAGNDVDCCNKKKGYTWFENYGCYRSTESSCSAVKDATCSSMCTAGNDFDCCEKLDGYTWYDDWGCYPKKS